MKLRGILFTAAIICLVLVASCKGGSGGASTTGTRLTLAGNSVSRALYEQGLIPAFKTAYAKAHPGYLVDFVQSYEGSGAQERAIEAGLDANIAVLSLAPEMDKLVEDGLADKDWKTAKFDGIPATSVVVMVVRQGNPKHIKDWEDLTRPDVDVILPNPDTSGAARWGVVAMSVIEAEGASGLRTHAFNQDFLGKLRPRIKAFGKSGKEAQQIFSSGLGDVLVGWESEALDRKAAGDSIDIVYPASGTLKMEPPVAVITPKGQQPNAAAKEFVQFLSTPDAQKIYAQYHYRPSDATIEQQSTFQALPKIKTIKDLGGWEQVEKEVFGPDGIWPKSAK